MTETIHNIAADWIECSVCGQEWDAQSLISQHEYCRHLYGNGSSVAAHPVYYRRIDGKWVEIDPYQLA